MLTKQIAYEKWLGIKSHDQPPTLYRLLAVDAFESDPDAISYAADSRMALLRQFQISENARLAEQILSELSHARVVLLNAEKKAAYDAQLRQRVAAKGATVGSATLPVASPLSTQPVTGSIPSAQGSPTSSVFDLDSITPKFRSTTSTRPGGRIKKTNSLVWVAAASSVALVIVAIAIFNSFSGSQDLTLTTASSIVPNRSEPPKPPVHSIDSKSTATPSSDKGSDKPSLDVTKPASAFPIEPATSAPIVVAHQETTEPDSGKLIPALPAEKPQATAVETPKGTTADTGPKQPGLAPVPDANAQADATKLVQEVYGKEIIASKTAEQKKALAEKLLQAARENQTDRSSQFVLLRLSRDIATQASDCETAFQAIEETDKVFRIDALDMKSDVLRKCAAASMTIDQHTLVAKKAAEVSDEAVTKDNFTVAKPLIELALGEAKKAKDNSLVKRFSERSAEIEGIAHAYDTAKKALAALEKSSNDPEANLAMGKYKCFIKGDWEHGLPMLALGNDPTLKALADEEAKGAASSAEQAKLGDSWWTFAESQKGIAKKQSQNHAAHWYGQALPGLSGLVKDKATKRLSEINNPVTRFGTGGWIVIFRSADASIWNTNLKEGPDRFAVSLDAVRDDVRFLRLRPDPKREVIIAVIKNQLGLAQDTEKYGWNGTSVLGYNAHMLGVFNKQKGLPPVRGMIRLQTGNGVDFSGWGFGVRTFIDDRQGYVWEGQEIQPTVFEISVRSSPLPQAEQSFLLK